MSKNQDDERPVWSEIPCIICVGGPSCVGKDTIIRMLLQMFPEWRFLPRHTTRPPRWVREIGPDGRRRRRKEKNGKDYHFDSPMQFNSLWEGKSLVGVAPYCGYLYGASVPEVERHQRSGTTLIGAIGGCSFELRKNFPDRTLLIYVSADTHTLMKRIRDERRDVDNQQFIRMKAHTNDFVNEGMSFDRVFLNNDGRTIEEVVEEILDYLQAWQKKHKRQITGFNPP